MWSIYFDLIRSDPIRSDPIRSDPVRSDPIRSDLIWSDLKLCEMRWHEVRWDEVRSGVLTRWRDNSDSINYPHSSNGSIEVHATLSGEGCGKVRMQWECCSPKAFVTPNLGTSVWGSNVGELVTQKRAYGKICLRQILWHWIWSTVPSTIVNLEGCVLPCRCDSFVKQPCSLIAVSWISEEA